MPAPGSFGAIFSMEGIDYLPHLVVGLAEVRRLLRPGGRFAGVFAVYGEHPASHRWPGDLDVPVPRRLMAGWRSDVEAAGLSVVSQTQWTVPAGPGVSEWKTTCGFLCTLGQRAHSKP